LIKHILVLHKNYNTNYCSKCHP